MSRWFAIEHVVRGAYVGLSAHPRSGEPEPAYRYDHPRRRAMSFISTQQAEAEIEEAGINPKMVRIIAIAA